MWKQVTAFLVLYEGYVLMENTFRLDEFKVTSSEESTRIAWSYVDLKYSEIGWSSTEVSIRWVERNNNVTFLVTNTKTWLDMQYLDRGLLYQLVARMLDRNARPVSDFRVIEFTTAPFKVSNFTASLEYGNNSNGNYPKFISFEYDVQRKSDYSGHRIQCGIRISNGSLNYTFEANYKLQYASWSENIAFRKRAEQSSNAVEDGQTLGAGRAVDRLIGPSHPLAKTLYESNPWWSVDLERIFQIEVMILYNGQQSCTTSNCRRVSARIKYFADNSRRTEDFCLNSTTNILSRLQLLGIGPREVEKFDPPFSARTVTICSENVIRKSLMLMEVEIFELAKPIHRKKSVRIKNTEFPSGRSLDCRIFSVVNDSLSPPVNLSKPLITGPNPPKEISFDYGNDALVISFALHQSDLDLYRQIHIHFLLEGNLHTLENSVTFAYKKQLLPLETYTVESWTSALMSVGRVNSNYNFTSTFVAEPAKTERQKIITKLSIFGFAIILAFSVCMTVVLSTKYKSHRRSRKHKLKKQTVQPSTSSWHKNLQPPLEVRDPPLPTEPLQNVTSVWSNLQPTSTLQNVNSGWRASTPSRPLQSVNSVWGAPITTRPLQSVNSVWGAPITTRPLQSVNSVWGAPITVRPLQSVNSVWRAPVPARPLQSVNSVRKASHPDRPPQSFEPEDYYENIKHTSIYKDF